MGETIKTVKLKLFKPNKGKVDYLSETKKKCDEALDFFINLIMNNSQVLEDKYPLRAVESLCIRTKERQDTVVDFYKEFPDFPSVTKRAIINTAIGMVRSYLSNLKAWEKSPKTESKPAIPKASSMPTFYKEDYSMEFKDIKNQFIKLRIYNGEKWTFVNYPVKFTKQFLDLYAENEKAKEYNKKRTRYRKQLKLLGLDSKQIKEIMKNYPANPYLECLSPSLSWNERKKEWYICFPFKKEIKVDKIEDQIKKRKYQKDAGCRSWLTSYGGYNDYGRQ
ncbi:hypothetical protein SAMN02746089_00051 [Caldanaerobius fijiensis DSM 17918]|uniref:Transposase n=1 Tax=Caldanaerobius fijiensis DSM 17918 TaxID=1121256 RepID=A0A1M4SIP8_9THEO|nr:hypothetical protein [Caldanaerobius fijiensis]SHE32066.1 hypothetical protein SAMN02746089_00051 [Caldanaerobius fijiensis DSM 17918]